MTCAGRGLPDESDLLMAVQKANISKIEAQAIMHDAKTIVNGRLSEWIDK